MCGAFNGKRRWVLWLCLTHFTTSEKCCCPGINGLKRMRTVVEEAAISYKRTEEPLKCVLIHSCTLCRQRCQTYWWSCSWMTVINVSQQLLGAWFYLEHHKGALSTNICSMGGLDESNPWEYQGCSDVSLNVFGVLLPSCHIVCVRGNYADIWLSYELPGGMRLYLYLSTLIAEVLVQYCTVRCLLV